MTTDELRGLHAHYARLAREYGELKERVAEYNRRRFILPGEAEERRVLQRVKLRTKDALAELANRIAALEHGK